MLSGNFSFLYACLTLIQEYKFTFLTHWWNTGHSYRRTESNVWSVLVNMLDLYFTAESLINLIGASKWSWSNREKLHFWCFITLITNRWRMKKKKMKWRVASHTLNLCSAFNPSKCTHTAVNTHPEQRAANAAVPGEQLGVQCLAQGSHLSRGIEGGESAGYSLPPPTIPARPETRTHDLQVTSPTLYPLGHDFPHGWMKDPFINPITCR